MKLKTVTMTEDEFNNAKLDAYKEGTLSSLERFNRQNNLYIKIGKAIEDLIYEIAEQMHEDY